MKFKFFHSSLCLFLVFRLTSSQGSGSGVNGNASQVLSTPEECARECRVGDQPKNCYYQWTVEHYSTMGTPCDMCRSNSTLKFRDDCQCIIADGFETSALITANRMFPGPAIVVCLHDFVIVDVTNRVPGTEITIHWHGIFQHGYQHYDGVPYVTQCPIQEGSTFRYQWAANNPGTHFWHSHSGLQKSDGLNGPLIVREPKVNETLGDLWDHDGFEYVIMINDFIHDGADAHFPGTVHNRTGQSPDNLYINGLGQWTDPITGVSLESPIPHFTVSPGGRYRFRLINACSLTCSVQMSIEGHDITVIATDGVPMRPVNVTSITSASAERYDFVLNADQEPRQYWMQFRGLGDCAAAKQHVLAILSYETASSITRSPRPTYDVGVDPGIILNPIDTPCNSMIEIPNNVVCLTECESISGVPAEILKPHADVQLYQPFNFHILPDDWTFEPGKYRRFMAGPLPVTASVGNISNALPPSPFLSQRNSIPDEQICGSTNPPSCNNPGPCQCAHLERVPLNSVVEMILMDGVGAPGMSHPFHLHGHVFYLVGEVSVWDHNLTTIDEESVRELDAAGLVKRNLARPLAKDTYSVPNSGFSIIRFLANNPGYWFFHCHFAFHIEVGMSLVIQVGEDGDIPPKPEGFPRCGNFVPAIEFPNR